MDIKINCPNCGQHVLIDSTAVGQQVACPTCASPFAIAGSSAPPPARKGSFRLLWVTAATTICILLAALGFWLIGNGKGRQPSPGSPPTEERATTPATTDLGARRAVSSAAPVDAATNGSKLVPGTRVSFSAKVLGLYAMSKSSAGGECYFFWLVESLAPRTTFNTTHWLIDCETSTNRVKFRGAKFDDEVLRGIVSLKIEVDRGSGFRRFVCPFTSDLRVHVAGTFAGQTKTTADTFPCPSPSDFPTNWIAADATEITDLKLQDMRILYSADVEVDSR